MITLISFMIIAILAQFAIAFILNLKQDGLSNLISIDRIRLSRIEQILKEQKEDCANSFNDRIKELKAYIKAKYDDKITCEYIYNEYKNCKVKDLPLGYKQILDDNKFKGSFLWHHHIYSADETIVEGYCKGNRIYCPPRYPSTKAVDNEPIIELVINDEMHPFISNNKKKLGRPKGSKNKKGKK